MLADFKEPEPDGRPRVLEILLAGLNPVDLHVVAGGPGRVEPPCVVGLRGSRGCPTAGAYFNARRRRDRCARGRLRGGAERGAGDGYDVVLGTVFGPALQVALAALAPGARLITVGAAAGQTVEICFREIIQRTLIAHSNQERPSRPGAARTRTWPASRRRATSPSRSTASRCRGSKRGAAPGRGPPSQDRAHPAPPRPA